MPFKAWIVYRTLYKSIKKVYCGWQRLISVIFKLSFNWLKALPCECVFLEKRQTVNLHGIENSLMIYRKTPIWKIEIRSKTIQPRASIAFLSSGEVNCFAFSATYAINLSSIVAALFLM